MSRPLLVQAVKPRTGKETCLQTCNKTERQPGPLTPSQGSPHTFSLPHAIPSVGMPTSNRDPGS